MSDGNHDEDEAWLLARERGIPDASTPEAKALLYSRLDALVADLPEMPSAFVPRPGWQQRLLVALGEPTPGGDPVSPTPGSVSGVTALQELAATPVVAAPPRGNAAAPKVATAKRRRWGIPAVSVALTAGLAVALVGGTFYRRHQREPDDRAVAMAVAVAHDSAAAPERASRSRGATVGDDLLVRAVVVASGELRVYGEDGVEQGRCAAPDVHCSVEHSGDRTTLVLRMPVQAVGELRAFLFSPALGGSSGGLEADVAAAVRAKIVVTPLEPVRFLESAPRH